MLVERSGRYAPRMREILREEGLPEELVAVCLIESGFNPLARSRAHAVGPWQFQAGTARRVGLAMGWWVDERKDPERSTRAAAAHLKDLHARLGSWPLALAAYNAGEGRVNRALAKRPGAGYWDLPLPVETRNFVPKACAVMLVLDDPTRFGLEAPEENPWDYESLQVEWATSLDVVADACGVSRGELRDLNPALIRDHTPPGPPAYSVRVPAGAASRGEKRLAEVPLSQRTTLLTHSVRSGESLWVLARRYNTSIEDLARVNRLANPSLVRPGQKLIVPVPVLAADDGINALGDPSGLPVYVVQRGDTLSEIAKRHRVTMIALQQVNDLASPHLIFPGDHLRLPIR